MQVDNKTLLLDSPQGDNTWKLGEIILGASGFKLLGLLAGFPSYGALVGTLGLAGVGKNIDIKVVCCLTLTI